MLPNNKLLVLLIGVALGFALRHFMKGRTAVTS